MKQLILTFVLGAMASLAMAPYNFVPTILLGLSILYINIEKSKSWQKSTLLGFFFSLGYFGFSLSWVGNALLVENNPYRWAWPLAVSGLPLILSCFTATATLLHFFIKQKTSKLVSFFAFVILLSLSEYARGHLFTGFPWNTYGYTWIDISPIAQLASLYNIYLLTAVTIFWAASLGFVASCSQPKKQKFIIVATSIITLTSSYAFGALKIKNAAFIDTKTQMIIVQPNIKQSEKWQNDKRQRHFTTLIELSRYEENNNNNGNNHIIIWPETAIAQDIINSPKAIDMIRNMLSSYPKDVFLITGALRSKGDKYYNSIITFNKNGEIINTYDKSHLVPFGEYMPFSNIIDIAPIVGFTGFQKGTEKETIKLTRSLSFTPQICYEIIFPQPRQTNSNFIVNVTNDAWYGDSAGPHQHLVQSQFRAIETGLPVYRAANTGISAAIDPLGYIIQKKMLSQTGKIQANLKFVK